jgi:hypothetical protein
MDRRGRRRATSAAFATTDRRKNSWRRSARRARTSSRRRRKPHQRGSPPRRMPSHHVRDVATPEYFGGRALTSPFVFVVGSLAEQENSDAPQIFKVRLYNGIPHYPRYVGMRCDPSETLPGLSHLLQRTHGQRLLVRRIAKASILGRRIDTDGLLSGVVGTTSPSSSRNTAATWRPLIPRKSHRLSALTRIRCFCCSREYKVTRVTHIVACNLSAAKADKLMKVGTIIAPMYSPFNGSDNGRVPNRAVGRSNASDQVMPHA